MPLEAGYLANFTMKQNTTISSGELTQWSDVDNQYTFTVPSGYTGPDTTDESLNGTPVARFDEGVNALRFNDASYNLNANANNTSQIVHQYVMKVPTEPGNWLYIRDDFDSGNRHAIIIKDDASLNPVIYYRVGADNVTTSAITDSQYIVITVVATNFNNGGNIDQSIDIWVDDTKIIDGTTIDQRSQNTDGISLGISGTDFSSGGGHFHLAEFVEYYDQDLSDTQIQNNITYLENQWTADNTAPTYTTDGTLAEGASDTNSVEITFDKAEDNVTAQSNIIYRLYRAPQGSDLSTLSAIDSNGSEVASDTDVTSLTDDTIVSGQTYEYNVTAEDESVNRLAYDQIQILADTLVGNITLDGSPVENANVAVHTVDDFELTNLTFIEIVQTDASGDYTITSYDDSNHYFLSVLYLNEEYTGTAESGGNSTLQDTDQSWTVSEFNDGQRFIELTGGTGSGQIRRIIDNGTDVINVEYDWDTNPDATTQYRIGKAYSDESRFIQSKS